MSSLFRPVSRFALACAAIAAVPACNLVLGLDDYIDCPEDAKCASVGGSGGATATTSGTSSTTDSMSTSSSTSSATGGTGGSGGAPPVPTCTDGVKNGGETGKDCGGSCATTMPCPDGEGCLLGTDCVSNVCKGNLCIAPMCGDMLKNGSETDVDCGGSLCPPCAVGKVCAVAGDCESAVCTGMACVAATCTDTVKNGAETAVDCGGGGCPGCAPGLACNGAGDCESAICQANSCVDYRVWGRRFGDGQDQTGNRVSLDGGGNVLVPGYFWGSINPGGGVLTACNFDQMSCPVPDFFITSMAADGSHRWSKRIINQGDPFLGGYSGLDATTDSAGNAWVVARGNGKIDLGGSTLNPPAACGATCGTGTAIAKYSSSGTHLWSKRFDTTGGAGDVLGWQIAANGSTDSVITGSFTGTVNFGGGALTATSFDVFVLKLDTLGNHVWSKRFGDASSVEQYGQAAALDVVNNVILAGYFRNGINFGGSTLTSAGGSDIFVAKLNTSGVHVWSKRFGDVQNQSLGAPPKPSQLTTAVDPSGSVLVAGVLLGNIDFGGGMLMSNGTSAFVAKLSDSGTHMWSKALSGVTLGHIAADSANNVFLVGSSTGPIDFGGSTLPSSGGFVAKLGSDGSHVWSQRLAGVGPVAAAANAQNIFLTGALNGTADFGGTPLVSAGATDAFVAKILNP